MVENRELDAIARVIRLAEWSSSRRSWVQDPLDPRWVNSPEGLADAEAINFLLSALATRTKALERFAEAARKAEISGVPPFQFVSADDYDIARKALSGGQDV